MIKCFCTGRTDITCNETYCSIAGPGKPYSANECRTCWLRTVRKLRPIQRTVPIKTVSLPNTPRLNSSERCIHLGVDTGEKITCRSCMGNVQLKLFACGVYGRCTIGKATEGIACCNGTPTKDGLKACEGYKPMRYVDRSMKWAYGITTVPQRRADLFPRTLTSLKLAGFNEPRLFVDGDNDSDSWQKEFGFETVCRGKNNIRTFGNWWLGMIELYIREPTAERYAMFQDDFVTYPNLRNYLESCRYPVKGYWNLYTFPANQDVCPKDHIGWYESNQAGRGAVALVFDRDTLLTLLEHQHFVERPLDADRGHKAIDGGIVTAMRKAGYKEYVHNPSLTQHVGEFSTMRNKPHKQAISFRGEEFNALELIQK